MAEINNTLLTTLIKGLKYKSKTDEYTFNHKTYKLREVKASEEKDTEHYYFVNIVEPTDLKLVKVVKGIPSYDGFNNVTVGKQLRKLEYQREYYKKVLKKKRQQQAKENAVEKVVKVKKEKQEKPKKTYKPIKCACCGKEFTPTQSKQKYCCHKCQLKYNSKKQAEKKKEENKIEKVCPICNKTFEGTPRQTYCSKKCYKVSQQDGRRQRYEREKAQKQNSGKKTIVVKKKNVK